MTHPFLQIQKVSKTYLKKKQIVKEALKEVFLEVNQGEVLGLLGVNGAGKTTLISILATLHPLTCGDVLWEGKSIYQDLLNYRKVVGLCPQHISIEKKLSLGEHLVFSGKCYGMTKACALSRKEALLDQFSLRDYANFTIDEVSGGYKQRFLIARALMHEPSLVILDEPTVGLDSHIRRELWEMIADLRSNKIAVILTTHYLDEAEYLSDRICLIHEGSVRITDTPENLKKKHQKNNLEEVFLKFVDDPDAEIFNSGGAL